MRLLHILSISVVLAPCVVFGLLLSERGQYDPRLEEFLSGPSAVERFRAQGGGSGERSAEEPPAVFVVTAHGVSVAWARAPMIQDHAQDARAT
jgi:hypothetical protein